MINWRYYLTKSILNLSGSNIPKYLKYIENFNIKSENESKKIQEEELKRLLYHSYKNVPYYSKILKNSGVIDKKGNVCIEKFNNIPILTKNIIRKEWNNLLSNDYKERSPYKNSSGGSTGEPIKFIQDKSYNDWNIATKIFYFNGLGKKIGEPEIKLWGSDRDIIKGNLSIKERVGNFLYNRKFFNSYNFSEDQIKELIKIHNNYKPVSYWAYVESAYELAKYILNNKIIVHKPKFIVTSIGPLYEEVRNTIKKAFNCEVYDQYGSREVGFIAGESENKCGLKTFPWFNKVELKKRPEGKVIVTNLKNYSMPLIRYEIGDVAASKDNNSLDRIVGRTLGYFKKEDGSLVHSHYIVQALFYRDWIKRFQIIQEGINKINIIIEKQKKEREEDIKDIRNKTKILLGNNCEISVKFVKRIMPTDSGKFLYTRSEIR